MNKVDRIITINVYQTSLGGRIKGGVDTSVIK